MLTDNEIALLCKDERFKKYFKVGIKSIGTDIVASGNGEVRTDISFISKSVFRLSRSRVIRDEIAKCCQDFLCKYLDLELEWPREPASINLVCEQSTHQFLWMRYDVPRVRVLLEHCENILTDPVFRDLIKEHSSYQGDKNERLKKLQQEIRPLLNWTIRSIRSKGLFDDLLEFQKDEFYQLHENEIQKKFLESVESGKLGLPPVEHEGELHE